MSKTLSSWHQFRIWTLLSLRMDVCPRVLPESAKYWKPATVATYSPGQKLFKTQFPPPTRIVMLWLFSPINSLLHVLRPSLSPLITGGLALHPLSLMKQPELWERSVECCLPVRGRADTLAGMWGGTWARAVPRVLVDGEPPEAEPEELLQEALDQKWTPIRNLLSNPREAFRRRVGLLFPWLLRKDWVVTREKENPCWMILVLLTNFRARLFKF